MHISASKRLIQIQEQVGDCRRCGLCETRTNIVFGTGSATAHVMFVGEAPGADEDAQGQPFVGRAGKLLDKMIAAMGFAREDVYIANVLMCRPPDNRDPSQEEEDRCLPFLREKITAIRPQVIVTLGRTATYALMPELGHESLSKLHGRIFTWNGTPLVPTFHPAFLLRTPSGKPYAWRDLKVVLKLLRERDIIPPHNVRMWR